MATKKGKKGEAEAPAKPEPEQDEGADPVADMPGLPRVAEIGWVVRPKPPAVVKPTKPAKAVVSFTLRPFTPRSKQAMVTMSDLSMNGSARGGSPPARNKRRD